ncbi:MAG: aminotransferase class V-fold PLP-dependent enzyme [Planctomycetes bacterium]|nr:aminotransferase class V-fold PLP-dependent enzyme [Planctomycetota bacterium]
MLDCQRALFDLPDHVHYLNCAYMAPMSRAVEAAGVVGLARKRRPYEFTPAHFFDESERLRALFGRLVGAPDGERVALVPSVSYGMAIVARNTPLAARQTIVVAHEQFPSNVYAWRKLCTQRGAELVTVEPAPGAADRAQSWNERLLAALDGRTAVVALPHVHWADGTRFDLEALGARARELGAALVVDGTQSVGALEFDVERVRPDALVCAGYKWLLGPYSLGYAYFGPRYDGGDPLEENWIAREGSEDFRALVQYHDAYQPGARRYDVGERSNLHLMPMAVAALEQVLDWRVERIQEYTRALASRLVARAAPLGFVAQAEPGRAGHLLGLRAPATLELASVAERLRAAEVHVSLRGQSIRVAPHLYNDERDVDALVDVLASSAAAS